MNVGHSRLSGVETLDTKDKEVLVKIFEVEGEEYFSLKDLAFRTDEPINGVPDFTLSKVKFHV